MEGVATVDRPRGARTVLLIAVPVLAVMLAFVWILATSEPATDRVVKSPLLDRVAPAIAGDTLGGASFDLDRERGRFVLVNFFATWCTPCKREHPELVRFSEDHEQIGDARVVSVLYDDQTGTAADFFEREGGSWPVVIDTTGRVALEYGVSGVPESYLIGPDGRVRAKIIGGVTSIGLDRILGQVQSEEGP